MMSSTKHPLRFTHVLFEPLFTSRSLRHCAQSDSVRPITCVRGFPLCKGWTFKSSKTSTWRGRHRLTQLLIPSKNSSNVAMKLLGETCHDQVGHAIGKEWDRNKGIRQEEHRSLPLARIYPSKQELTRVRQVINPRRPPVGKPAPCRCLAHVITPFAYLERWVLRPTLSS